MKGRLLSGLLGALLLCSCATAAAEVDTTFDVSTNDPPPAQLVFAGGDADPFSD